MYGILIIYGIIDRLDDMMDDIGILIDLFTIGITVSVRSCSTQFLKYHLRQTIVLGRLRLQSKRSF